MAGAFSIRHAWRVFRRRFDHLRLKPLLDYTLYRNVPPEGGAYRFMGTFESTDGHILWISSETLTIPVVLAKAHIYILPTQEGKDPGGAFDPYEDAPERIRWDRVSSLTKGAKVFVGGNLVQRQGRWVFAGLKKNPLLVIFYDGSDRSITMRTIRAGRHKNEYWNRITPYAFVAGACCQLGIAVSFLSRPAFRLTVITAFIALLTPLLPLFPPGILFTLLYRRLWWRARLFRAYRDVLMLPLSYFPPGVWERRLPDGERYGGVFYENLPPGLPLLIPENAGKPRQGRKGAGWYVFGALPEGSPLPGDPPPLPQEPRDLFATFGALPGNPSLLARRYTVKAYMGEIIACLFLFAGIGINLFFIILIFSFFSQGFFY